MSNIKDKKVPNVPNLRFREFVVRYVSNQIENAISIKCEKHNPVNSNIKYECIELESLASNTGELQKIFDSSNQKSIKNHYSKSTVLFGKLRPYLRKFYFTINEGVCSSEIWVMSSNILLPKYLFYYVQTNYFIDLCNISSGSKMPRADWSLISREEIAYPFIIEQEKIAKFLTLVDERIATQNKIIDKLESLIKGIRARIFKRDVHTLGNANNMQLGELLSEYSVKNSANLYIPVAVGKYGIRKRDEIYSKELSLDYSKNKVISQNTLIIGMGSTQIDIGILLEDEQYCVSPAYSTYKISGISAMFLNEMLIQENSLLSNKYMIVSARQGKSVNKTDLMKHNLVVPSKDYQQDICTMFKKFYGKLKCEKDMLLTLQRQKAYLLKNMFI